MPDSTRNFDGHHLPYSHQAEQVVLGSILLDPQSIHQVNDRLSEEHFYLPEHQLIYRVMRQKIMTDGQAIDFVTVLEALKADGYYAGDEGKKYLLELTRIVPFISNITHYADIIREKHTVRTLILVSREIMEQALDPAVESDTLIDSAEQKIFEIRDDRAGDGLVPIRRVVEGAYDTLTKMSSEEHRNDYIGIPSGFKALDHITNGLNKSDLVIVGARPGMGKTAFALNIARHVAGLGKTVAFFALEMSSEQLVNRLISTEARVSSRKLRTGILSPEEWTHIFNGANKLYDLPIFFNDHSAISAADMKSQLRRMKPRADLAVIDYLQLMQPDNPRRSDNRTNEVAAIARSLKGLAKDLRIPLLVCAQLSRGTEKQSNHRPGLSDLRESGQIEQDADQVMFLYRDEY
ncbi:MAG: replicative DNA helicase, partial [Oscillospiraceae bacterium]|nr:replicative DNA helicase [Oscillospiraceae bacterium]